MIKRCNHHQFLFLNDEGALANMRDLAQNPTLVAAVAGDLQVHGVAYETFYQNPDQVEASFVRMELQKPWPRLKNEIGKLAARFGTGPQEGPVPDF